MDKQSFAFLFHKLASKSYLSSKNAASQFFKELASTDAHVKTYPNPETFIKLVEDGIARHRKQEAGLDSIVDQLHLDYLYGPKPAKKSEFTWDGPTFVVSTTMDFIDPDSIMTDKLASYNY